MPILNYTTTVAAHRSIMEIQSMLAARGASKIMIDYAGSQPVAVSFQLLLNDKLVAFRLPCNHEGILRALQNQKVAKRYQTIEHAHKVAWRIIKTWTAAQMAIIDAQQAAMPEVFLPYLVTSTGRTMYQELESGKNLLK